MNITGLRPLIALMVGACILGSGSILVRMSTIGPAATGFWRLTMALPVIVVLAHRARGEYIGRGSSMTLVAGLLFAFDLAFWHYGIMKTSVANANLLANMAPVFVAILSWIFLRERLRPQFVSALVLACGGACFLAIGKSCGSAFPAKSLGDFLSAATAIWYALYLLAVGLARRTDSAANVMLWSTVAGAPVLLVIAIMLREPIVPVTIEGWATCVGLGFMHVLGQGALAWALGRLPATTASVVILIQPVAAASLAWVLFAEIPGGLQVVGAALVIGGVALAQFESRAVPSRAIS